MFIHCKNLPRGVIIFYLKLLRDQMVFYIENMNISNVDHRCIKMIEIEKRTDTWYKSLYQNNITHMLDIKLKRIKQII